MLKSIFQAKSSNFRDLRDRLIFLVTALLVFRFGAHVPVPGLNSAHVQELMSGHSGGLMGMFNLLSGGAFARVTVLALGLTPYIMASLVIQMAAFVVPALERLKKEGEAGQRTMTRYTRLGAVALAGFQAFGIATMLEGTAGMVLTPGLLFEVTTVMSLTTGTMVMMWLGEQITERGLGNGVSMLIFAGIAAGIPTGIGAMAELFATGSMGLLTVLAVAVAVVATIGFVVFIEKSIRKISLTYARHAGKPKSSGAQTAHLPLKLNTAGVMPPILASVVMAAPLALVTWASSLTSASWLKTAQDAVSEGRWAYTVMYSAAIVFFTFLYTSLTFNSKETAERLKSGNVFVPGFRPGEQTAEYLKSVLTRLTLAGSAYIALVCLLPTFLSQKLNLPFNFGGTSLLIAVVVTMDFMAQLKKYQLTHQYTSMLKKSAPASAPVLASATLEPASTVSALSA